MYFSLFDRENAASGIGESYAKAAVLEAAGDAGTRGGVVCFFYGFQALDDAGVFSSYLTVGHGIAGLKSIETTNFVVVHTQFISQQIEIRLNRKATLRDTEATERSGWNQVSIDGPAVDLEILEVVRARGMSACPLEHRASK